MTPSPTPSAPSRTAFDKEKAKALIAENAASRAARGAAHPPGVVNDDPQSWALRMVDALTAAQKRQDEARKALENGLQHIDAATIVDANTILRQSVTEALASLQGSGT